MLGNPFPLSHFHVNMFQIAVRMSPTLRLVAINSSFALSRRFNLPWGMLARAFFGASCLSPATQSAY